MTKNPQLQPAEHLPAGGWNASSCQALISQLLALRLSMLEREAQLAPGLSAVDPAQRPSAINLAHYLALRQIDLRSLQEQLAALGLSSLGRAETHVLANVDQVLGILHCAAGLPWAPMPQDRAASDQRGSALLTRQAGLLFGAPPPERGVRIMVTLPSEAAHDETLLAGLVAGGMDIARINCAHDGAVEWVAMAEGVRKAAQRAQRPVRVLMDLGGPKLRTGPVAARAPVCKLKPEKDDCGRVTAKARLGLHPVGSALAVAGVPLSLAADAGWLRQLRAGDRVELEDARGAHRRLHVVEVQAGGVVVECKRTCYMTALTELRLHRPGHRHHGHGSRLGGMLAPPGRIHLQRGDILRLTASGTGHDAQPAAETRNASLATIACTLPEVLARVRKGERIWFDDGRIGGVVRRAGALAVEVEITEARDGGEALAADKGINLPDTRLDLPALTAKDLADLPVVARHADLVGLSFAQSAADVLTLRGRLADLGADHLGLILKIETQRGFAHLPEMLLAAMAGPAAGVMIARGDLAVECGYERLAEVQEEILWACEAAHMPVVWATQVLETLARTGRPSRAEITDAAMGGRAECVMLNKGPHIVDAMRTLNGILRRMQAHQSKKRTLLRALKAWGVGAPKLTSFATPRGGSCSGPAKPDPRKDLVGSLGAPT